MATHESGQSRASRSDKDEDVDTPDAPDAAAPEGTERREKLGEDVDALLDEIDDVLETNAEDFVKSFVQKGGQ
ncbi:ubiquitin-like protein Pup [Jatrophihabitans sp. YIM 134969]